MHVDTIRRRPKRIFHKPEFSKRTVFRHVVFSILLLGVAFALAFFLGKSTWARLSPFIDLGKLFSNGRYLVLFQNNTELRPSGGFIGSFAVVEFENFQPKNWSVETNIFKRDKEFALTHSISPPKQFEQEQWYMRDSNWAVDYPEAAQTVAWFYQQGDPEPLDGVVAVDTTFLKAVLDVLGPIKIPSIDEPLTPENAIGLLQYEVEKGYYQTTDGKVINEPKTAIQELFSTVMGRVSAGNLPELSQALFENLRTKHLLLYFSDPGKESIAASNNWGGKILDTQGDYLAINSANLGGGKSSLNVKQAVSYKVSEEDGKLVGDLTITRTHTGKGVWPDSVNRNYMRVLVPKGSTLVAAERNGQSVTSELDQTPEAGKSVFGLWVTTAPQTSTVVHLRYQLLEISRYSLLMQKQPGALADEVQVIYGDRVLYDGSLDQDHFIE